MAEKAEPEEEPEDGPQVTSRLGPVRAGDGRSKSRFEGYVEHPNLQFESEVQEVDERLLRHGVSVLEDGGCRLPCATWSLHEACIPKWMATLLPEPTALQAVVWPVLRTNRDVVAIAEHGCGKTLAYAVPLLIRAAALQGARHEQPDLWRQSAWQEWRQRPPDGVILVPTSEIVQQVLQDLKPLATAGRVHVAGGDEDMTAQRNELSRAGVLVLTPWLLQCQSWALGKDEDLAALNQDVLIIFDDADDVIKDGDDEGTQARTVLDFMPKNRVLAFFSTSWPQRTDEIARRHLRNETVMVYATSECPGNAKSFYLESRFVNQGFEMMNALAKQQRLLVALQALAKRLEGKASTVGVFCNKHDTAEQVATFLSANVSGRVTLAHELMDLATTMLGRGYPFPKMQWMINYDMPENLLEYLCRIRLASHCDSPGYALTFLTKDNLLQAIELKSLLQDLGQDCPELFKDAEHSRHALALRINPRGPNRRFSETNSRGAGHIIEKTLTRPLPDADWKDWKPLTVAPGGTAKKVPSGKPMLAVKPKSAELPDLISFD